MTAASRIATPFAAHAVCMAAGVRDGLRATQFYVRDLSNADTAADTAWLSRWVARAARLTDRFMTWGAERLIALLLPQWRKLPSPFTPGMMTEVAAAIREDRLARNPLFNAYFFRAAHHIARRYCEPPHLILEHRIDAARRRLAMGAAAGPDEETLVARILIGLVQAQPVARVGAAKGGQSFIDGVEHNLAVFAIACVTLLFAEEGNPAGLDNDDKFFAVAGALIGPRLPAIAALVARHDEAGLARELKAIKETY